MILQALVRHYEDLARQDMAPPLGWKETNISYALCINSYGDLERIICIKNPSPNNKKLIPQTISLPIEPSGRTSGSKPAFLWDSSKYILGMGIDKSGNLQRRLKFFEDSKALYHKILDTVDTNPAKAVLNFYNRWDPAQSELPAVLQENKEILSGANLVFRFEGKYIHDDPAIRQAWQSYYDNTENGSEQICLVTGKNGSIAKTHPAIVGAGGTNPKLVSFDKDSTAFCSYGKTQGFNAPVSEYAAFAYTTALNHLLKDRKHIQPSGNTSVVCWAEGGEPDYQDAFAAFTFGTQCHYTEQELRDMVKHLLSGGDFRFNKTLLNPDRSFYILGLSPNEGRLSVRFFLQNSFGGFLQHVQEHYDRLDIVKPASDKFGDLSVKKLLEETVKNPEKDEPSPNMAGAVLRSVLMDEPYPTTLLHSVLLRIRAEHKVTRGRAAIIKAYYLKSPHKDIPKEEVLTVSLNPDSNNIPYTLGRLFSVLEDVQSKANPGINATIVDRYFNAASATPGHIFPVLLNLARKHLRKLDVGQRIYYEKQIISLTDVFSEDFPTRLSLPQQGAFQLGYYHQTQKRYEKKEESKNV